MAAATAMAVAGGVSAVGGIYQAISGAEQARDAKRELNALKTPELQNAYDDVHIPTLGAKLQTEEGSRNYATSVDALRSSGIRGIIGGLSPLGINENNRNRQIGADLDQYAMNIEMAKAGDKVAMRNIEEGRYNQDVAGLSSQINAGQQNTMQGIHGALQGVSSGVQGYVSQNNYENWLKTQGLK